MRSFLKEQLDLNENIKEIILQMTHSNRFYIRILDASRVEFSPILDNPTNFISSMRAF